MAFQARADTIRSFMQHPQHVPDITHFRAPVPEGVIPDFLSPLLRNVVRGNGLDRDAAQLIGITPILESADAERAIGIRIDTTSLSFDLREKVKRCITELGYTEDPTLKAFERQAA